MMLLRKCLITNIEVHQGGIVQRIFMTPIKELITNFVNVRERERERAYIVRRAFTKIRGEKNPARNGSSRRESNVITVDPIVKK